MIQVIWAVIKGLSLGPAIGKGLMWAFGYVRRYWRIVVPTLVLTALILTIVVGKLHYEAHIGHLQADLAQANAEIDGFAAAIQYNENALQECVAVNQANLDAYLEQVDRAEQAEHRVQQLTEQSNDLIEDIENEAQDLRGRDQMCRRLGDPLPDWFDAWLRH